MPGYLAATTIAIPDMGAHTVDAGSLCSERQEASQNFVTRVTRMSSKEEENVFLRLFRRHITMSQSSAFYSSPLCWNLLQLVLLTVC